LPKAASGYMLNVPGKSLLGDNKWVT
jgi:hypothetical protein